MADKFAQAAEAVKKLPSEPSNDDKLYLYGRFKQAKEGDVNTDRPGMMDFTGKYKWDAWNSIKGKDQEEAKQEYINKAIQLLEAAGDALSAEGKEALAQLKA